MKEKVKVLNINEITISRNGIGLVVTLFFYMLLGGFFIGTDLYHYNDPESAMSVLSIFSLMGFFGTMFLLGKKFGPIGLMVLSGLLMVAQIGYVIVSVSQTSLPPDWHDPSENWFTTILYILFSLLVLVFSFKVYRESRSQ